MIAASISAGATTLLLAIVFHTMPGLTRPELFFAVTVAPGFPADGEARRILARYRAWLWLGALAALAITALGAWRVLPMVGMAGPPALVLFAMLAFVDARRHVRPHAVAPSTVREAPLLPRARAQSGGWPLQLGPFALLGVAAAALWRRFDELPARVPVHVSITGEADRFAARSPVAVFGALAAGALLCALLAGIGLALRRASRSVAASGEAERAEQAFKRLTMIVLVGAEYLVALSVAAIALSPLFAATRLLPWLSLLEGAAAIAIVVALVRLGQGGTRRAAPTAEAGAPVGDRTRDERWKWGLFYADGDDPALFVEKRFGIGYTLNFGNPWSWAMLVLVGAVVAASLLLTR